MVKKAAKKQKLAYLIIAKRSKTILETIPAFSRQIAIYDAISVYSYRQVQVNIYTFAPGSTGNIALTEIGEIGSNGRGAAKFFKTTK